MRRIWFFMHRQIGAKIGEMDFEIVAGGVII